MLSRRDVLLALLFSLVMLPFYGWFVMTDFESPLYGIWWIVAFPAMMLWIALGVLSALFVHVLLVGLSLAFPGVILPSAQELPDSWIYMLGICLFVQGLVMALVGRLSLEAIQPACKGKNLAR